MKRISSQVDSDLEIAAISDRVLGMGGPALLFENVKDSSIPVAVNLLGTMERVVWSMGLDRQEQLEDLGKKLALLQQPRPPKGFEETKAFASVAWDLLKARPDIDLLPPCHQRVIEEKDLDLNHLPLLRPWPEDAGGAITPVSYTHLTLPTICSV